MGMWGVYDWRDGGKSGWLSLRLEHSRLKRQHRILEETTGYGIVLWVDSLLVCEHSTEHGPFWGDPKMASWALIFTCVYFV